MEDLSSPIDRFYAHFEGKGNRSIFSAAAELRNQDLKSIVQTKINQLARQLQKDATDFSNLSGSILPSFGHLVLDSRHGVAISISVRPPHQKARHTALSTFAHDEIHFLLHGCMEIWEIPSFSTIEAGGASPARLRLIEAPGEIVGHAGRTAHAFYPRTECILLSISSAEKVQFVENIETVSGNIISKSFARSEDCVLFNMLEMAIQLDCKQAMAASETLLCHPNHRIRLNALKCVLRSGTKEVTSLLPTLRADSHPVIRSIGTQLSNAQ